MTRRDRARLWALDHLPSGVAERPAEWLLAFLCVFSGIPTVAGAVESAAVEALLPAYLYRGWGICLLLGGLGLMCGLSSIRHPTRDGRYIVTRLPCYRLGLRLLMVACFTYAAALPLYAGTAGLLSAVPLIAFGGMCGIRLLTLAGRT